MIVRPLGRVPYLPTFEAMQRHTAARPPEAPDELWLCEHLPVYTLGLAGRPEHVLDAGDVPVVRTDRGGQVTFHGPGQVVAYPLVDLKRQGCYVREYVYRLETALLRTLEALGVTGHRVDGAPGIYVRPDDPFGHASLTGPRRPDDRFCGLAKIAAIGIKVSRHCTYHGVALNVAMDLAAFRRIDPCGYAGLATTDLSTIGVACSPAEVAEVLARKLANQFPVRAEVLP